MKRLTVILVGSSSTLDLIHQGGSVAMDLELQGNRTAVQSLPLANRAALHLDQQTTVETCILLLMVIELPYNQSSLSQWVKVHMNLPS